MVTNVTEAPKDEDTIDNSTNDKDNEKDSEKDSEKDNEASPVLPPRPIAKQRLVTRVKTLPRSGFAEQNPDRPQPAARPPRPVSSATSDLTSAHPKFQPRVQPKMQPRDVHTPPKSSPSPLMQSKDSPMSPKSPPALQPKMQPKDVPTSPKSSPSPPLQLKTQSKDVPVSPKAAPSLKPKVQPKVQPKDVPMSPRPSPPTVTTKSARPPMHPGPSGAGRPPPQPRPQPAPRGQNAGIRAPKKSNIGIVVAPTTCSSAPIPPRPSIPPRPYRGGPIPQRPPQGVPPPPLQAPRVKKPLSGGVHSPNAKGLPPKLPQSVESAKDGNELNEEPANKKEMKGKEVEEKKEDVIENDDENEDEVGEVEEEVVEEEGEEEEEEEEEGNEEEEEGDDDDEKGYENSFGMQMGMEFDSFGGNSGNAFLADGGMNFFRDRKISRKSMMYKDTWWTTLRPAKMESMPITSLLPEENAEGNDEAIPGFDDNITAVPSMATEINGDDDEQTSLPLI